jgi:hypothetical protein
MAVTVMSEVADGHITFLASGNSPVRATSPFATFGIIVVSHFGIIAVSYLWMSIPTLTAMAATG